MPLINKRWDGGQFRSGATFRRWTGSAWKSGATVRVWSGTDWIPSLRLALKSSSGGAVTTYYEDNEIIIYRVIGHSTLTLNGSGTIFYRLIGDGGKGADISAGVSRSSIGTGGSGASSVIGNFKVDSRINPTCLVVPNYGGYGLRFTAPDGVLRNTSTAAAGSSGVIGSTISRNGGDGVGGAGTKTDGGPGALLTINWTSKTGQNRTFNAPQNLISNGTGIYGAGGGAGNSGSGGKYNNVRAGGNGATLQSGTYYTGAAPRGIGCGSGGAYADGTKALGTHDGSPGGAFILLVK